MKKILVGYDGSEPAGHALAHGIRLAKAFQCPLTVLTAAADRLRREDGVLTVAADESLARWTADQGAARARREGVPEVDTRLSVEPPVDAIVHTAADGYDLLVIGHRGSGGLAELFMGSTAKSVVDRVECSVLVVR